MKNLFVLLKRFIPSYKRYVVLTFIFNFLSTIFNLFSFAAIIPILQIIFKVNVESHSFVGWDWSSVDSIVYSLKNNAMHYVENLIAVNGEFVALCMLAGFLVSMTLLKTGSEFLAGAMLVPVRTGVQRDIRNKIYR